MELEGKIFPFDLCRVCISGVIFCRLHGPEAQERRRTRAEPAASGRPEGLRQLLQPVP